MDPKEIIRQRNFAKNPQMALLEAIKELKGVIKEETKAAFQASEVKLVELLDKGIAAAEKRIIAEIPDIEDVADKMKGKPGKDSKAEDVAKILLDTPEFLQALKPKDGKSPTEEELVALATPIIERLMPVVENGKTPTKKELLALIRPLIPKVKNGETPSDAKLNSLIKKLLPKIKELTANDIAGKLNTLKGAVDQDVIKGLSTALRNLAKNIKGGASGGGMGNWVHKAFSTSSATTQVVADYRVAGAGMAHILRYQGQVLEYGTHYTIGSDMKTFTFLFTLQDNTNVSLTHVRT